MDFAGFRVPGPSLDWIGEEMCCSPTTGQYFARDVWEPRAKCCIIDSAGLAQCRVRWIDYFPVIMAESEVFLRLFSGICLATHVVNTSNITWT